MRMTRLLLAFLTMTGCGAPDTMVPADPLIAAVRASRVADALAAIDAGANPNSRAHDGSLPLVEAVRSRLDTMVVELLAAGADPLAADSSGTNAWDAVMATGDAGVADRLILHAARDAGAGPSVMRWFAGVRHEESAPPPWMDVLSGALLPLGLMYAAHHDRDDLIVTMRRGREIPNPTGYHALAVAARWGRVDAVRALLAIDVHPDLESTRRTTALLEAARDGRVEIAAVLLRAGADPNHADRLGDTALHWAMRYGQPEYAAVLQRAGADPERRNVSGQAPANVTLGDVRHP